MKYYVLLVLLVAPSVCALTNLSSNQTLDYNWSSSPGNESFYCSQPDQQLFCGFQNLSFSLDPGSTVVRTGSFNRVEAVCTTNITNQSKCVISDNLKPGERLRVDTSTCDLDIKAKDAPTTSNDAACSVEQVTHEEFIDFKFQGNDIVQVTAGNDSFSFDPRGTNIDEQKYKVKFLCPEVVNKNDLLSDDQVINTCRKLLPELATSFVTTSTTCIDAMTDTTRLISDRSNDIRVCEEEKGRYIAQISELQAQNQNLDQLINGGNNTEGLRTQLATASASAESERDQKFLFMFLMVLLAISTLFVAWLHFGRGGE